MTGWLEALAVLFVDGMGLQGRKLLLVMAVRQMHFFACCAACVQSRMMPPSGHKGESPCPYEESEAAEATTKREDYLKSNFLMMQVCVYVCLCCEIQTR